MVARFVFVPLTKSISTIYLQSLSLIINLMYPEELPSSLNPLKGILVNDGNRVSKKRRISWGHIQMLVMELVN